MKYSKCLLVLALLLIVHRAVGQKLSEQVSEQESDLSKIMKSSGTLLVRESHDLPNIPTMVGQDIECEIMVLNNLLTTDADESVIVGLVISSKEEYSTRSTNIDIDEIDGLIASIEMIKREGAKLVTNRIVSPAEATSSSAEIHYRTKDGMLLGVYERKGILKYAIKVSSAADWSLLKDNAIDILLNNLKTVKRASEEIKNFN